MKILVKNGIYPYNDTFGTNCLITCNLSTLVNNTRAFMNRNDVPGGTQKNTTLKGLFFKLFSSKIRDTFVHIY